MSNKAQSFKKTHLIGRLETRMEEIKKAEVGRRAKWAKDVKQDFAAHLAQLKAGFELFLEEGDRHKVQCWSTIFSAARFEPVNTKPFEVAIKFLRNSDAEVIRLTATEYDELIERGRL